MKGRDQGKGPPSADLLVCFPSRAHLTLMAPKPVCSPSRPSEPSTRRRRNHLHSLRNTSNRGGHASPQLWAKTKAASNNNNHHTDVSEPSSPKVTCAGQIKVRSKKGSCKSWQSVMEEIERLHNKNKKKKHSWGEAFGLKKDVMGFLTCLRNVRFDFRCFGGFPNVEVTSDEDEDDEDEVEMKEEGEHENESESSKAFSKWFMILQQSNEMKTEEVKKVGDDQAAPPPNALLLMRCRSAPAKSWLEEKEGEEEEEEKSGSEDEFEEKQKEEEKRETERLVVMRCGTDFSKFSCDIAKETWVVGGIKDMLSRSLSSKR